MVELGGILMFLGLRDRRKQALAVDLERRKKITRKQATINLQASIDRLHKTVEQALGEKDK